MLMPPNCETCSRVPLFIAVVVPRSGAALDSGHRPGLLTSHQRSPPPTSAHRRWWAELETMVCEVLTITNTALASTFKNLLDTMLNERINMVMVSQYEIGMLVHNDHKGQVVFVLNRSFHSTFRDCEIFADIRFQL